MERHEEIAAAAQRIRVRLKPTGGGCMVWTGPISAKGYGDIRCFSQNMRTHRVIWEDSNGQIPEGMLICHTCDNPPCCNISHLWMGTPKENGIDMGRKGRSHEQKRVRFDGEESPIEIGDRPLLMNDLFDKYERECIPELQPRSRRDYLGIMVYLRKEFGDWAPTEIKPRHVAAFLNVEKGRIHRNRMVTILSTVFYKAIGKWCMADDLTNPCTGVEKWPTKARTRYIEDAEFNAFRETCRTQVQIAMDLALLTAQRQSDIVGLTWKQIKAIGLPRDQWHIEICQGKTGKKLAIEITPDLETVLKRAKLMDPQWPREFVIRTKWGKRYTNDGFRAMWQRYMRAWMKAGNENFHFHDIRAKSLTDNPSLQAAYELSGHLDIRMTRRVYDRGVRKVKPLK